MDYRKIEIDKTNDNDKLELLLIKIATWHNLTPNLWISNYKVSGKDIDETVNRIKGTRNEDLFLAIAEEQNNVQGFIWAYKSEKVQDSVMILSLYTAEEHRGEGIATKLKSLLEEWCKLEGIRTIETTVHYKNSSMITLNQKLGYVPGMLYMTKILS